MGEGRDGPSHCPLPKVVVWSEEESLKLNVNQWKEDYVALPVPDESSLWTNYISSKSLYLTPIGIIPDDCDLLTALLFPDSVYPKDKAIETTIISNPISAIAEELIGSLSCLSCSPMEMALAAKLLEAKNNHDNIRSKESLYCGSSRVVAVKIQISTFLNPLNLHRFSPFLLSSLSDIFNYLPSPSFRTEIGAIIVNLQKLKISLNFQILQSSSYQSYSVKSLLLNI